MSDSSHGERTPRAERPMGNPHLIESLTHAADWLDAQVDAQRIASAHAQTDVETVRWHSRADGMAVASVIIRNLITTDTGKLK